MVLETLFMATGGVIVFHHAIYPLVLHLVAGARVEGLATTGDVADEDLPTVAIIVPAFDEETLIAEKIDNLSHLAYPVDRLRIRIVCDGCTDGTVEAASEKIGKLGPEGGVFELIVHRRNRGKVAVLNETISAASEELIVLTDVSAMLPHDALIRAVRHFRNPSIGVVTGKYATVSPDSKVDAYWRFQTRIKAAEAALGSPIGMHGAFYVFRRAASRPLEADTINDDVLLPMRIVEKGYAGVYDQSIPIVERETEDLGEDLARRKRLGAGAIQPVARLWRLADPRRPGLAFAFVSGKGVRAFMPFLLGSAAAENLLLVGSNIVWDAAMAVQVTVYGMGALALSNRRISSFPLAGEIGYFVGGYMMAGAGAFDYLFGRDRGPWRRITGFMQRTFLDGDVIRGKRIVDICVSLATIPVLAVLYAPIALAIKLESPGPVLYRQLRVGLRTSRKSDLFYLTKFRTMRVDAETKTGAVWASSGDPRVTMVGRFLRKTRLDEIPQCLDVLRGDMSIVGPRPERPQFFKRLEEEIPFYAERTYGIKPGITGLAQIKLPYDSCIEDVRKKVLHDHAYALQLSIPGRWFWMDLSIMLRTFEVMLLGKGL